MLNNIAIPYSLENLPILLVSAPSKLSVKNGIHGPKQIDSKQSKVYHIKAGIKSQQPLLLELPKKLEHSSQR